MNKLFVVIGVEYGRAIALYEDPGIVHLEMDCPSGEMIVADWIRIQELSDLYRANQDWSQELSVNHDAGKIRDTQRTLEKFNLLDLHLSNMAVKMFKKGGTLLIGDNYDPETDAEKVPSGYKDAGSVCTDRWSLTAINRVYLERILATVVDDPKAKVDAYLAENNYGVSVQKWKPGTHHLYFCGNWRDFSKTFQSPDLELPSMQSIYAVISDTPLALEPKVKPPSETPSF